MNCRLISSMNNSILSVHSQRSRIDWQPHIYHKHRAERCFLPCPGWSTCRPTWRRKHSRPKNSPKESRNMWLNRGAHRWMHQCLIWNVCTVNTKPTGWSWRASGLRWLIGCWTISSRWTSCSATVTQTDQSAWRISSWVIYLLSAPSVSTGCTFCHLQMLWTQICGAQIENSLFTAASSVWSSCDECQIKIILKEKEIRKRSVGQY